MTYPYADKPWFLYTQSQSVQHVLNISPQTTTSRCAPSALVIGGGLSGCQTAWHLAQAGFNVSLLEKQSTLAQAASGNRAGVIYGKYSAHHTAQAQFYESAYEHALQHIPTILGESDGVRWDNTGVLQLAFDEQHHKLHQALLTSDKFNADLIESVTAKQASQYAGFDVPYSGLFFKGAGWVYPKALCEALVKHPNITLHTYHEALTLSQNTQTTHTESVSALWTISANSHAQRLEWQADVVVIANADAATQFSQTTHWPLKTIRGQVSSDVIPMKKTKGTDTKDIPHCVICHSGYITPIIEQRVYYGASFNLKDPQTDPRQSDREDNSTTLKTHLPALFEYIQSNETPESLACSERVGFRCQTPDYLPIVGPVPDVSFYQTQYSDIQKQKRYGTFPSAKYHEGLFVNIAHGSRGIAQSGFAARIVCNYITQQHAEHSRDMLHAIHPARFLIREIIRSKV